ncbi:MAG TPA: SURF1 family protein [Burkholderiales bacterium]|nr:SURF1 family protein [Burkholderiales bacterium]
MALAAAACIAGIALGNWQAGRAEEKRSLDAQLAQALASAPVEISSRAANSQSLVLKRVAAKGRLIDEYTVFLDNKLRRGRAGYEVVTPLKLDGMHVLVNRGWVAGGRTREELPKVPVPAGITRIEGLALARLPHALEPGPASAGKVRQNIDIDAFARETGLRLQPVFIQQYSPADDGLVRDWPRPDAGAEKHASYALQWYSLAVLAVVLLIVLSIRRARPR